MSFKPRQQLLLLPSLLLTAWYAFMLLHETGHLLAALLTGGSIQQFILPTLGFSRTLVSPNPHPLLVTWAGPILGALFLPIAQAILRAAKTNSYTLNFLAAFALVANGAYIAFASFDRIGDAGDLLRYGAPLWTLWLFGFPAILLALLLFHRLGPRLGLATRPKPSDLHLSILLAILLIILSLILSIPTAMAH